MNHRLFTGILLVVLLGGLALLFQQRAQLASLRSQLGQRPPAAPVDQLDGPAPSEQTSPSPELLRLRGEIAVLRRELGQESASGLGAEELEEDWATVHSGARPSQQLGFLSFQSMTNVGHATPAAGLQTFNFVMRNQSQTPLDNSRMKAIWDVPDDFDDPNARYSIHLGEGMGSEIGYRIVRQEQLSTNEIRLVLEYERPDGSSFRRDRVLVERGGVWRVKPVSVTRVQTAD